MKKLLLAITALFAAGSIFAQSIPNAGFENWTGTPIMDPTGYQTSNDQNVQKSIPPQVFRVTDAYHGNYAVQLKTIKFGADTFASFIANGQPGGTWPGGCPISGTPTGMRVYYKFHTASADTAAIIIAFKQGGTLIGQYLYAVVDTTTTYTLFTQNFFPALSGTPDTVIFAATSSTRILNSNNNGGWSPNSYFQIDSVNFTGIATQPVKLDGDFENWVADTSFTLNQWSVQQSPDSGGPFRTTDAYSGKYAVELKTGSCSNCGNGVNPVSITTGKQGNSGPTGGYPYTLPGDSLDTLVFYYKYVPSINYPNDTGTVGLQFHANHSTQNWYYEVYLKGDTGYKKYTFPIDFRHMGWVPDSVLVSIQSSWCSTCSGNVPVGTIGSDLKVDQMSFTSELPITVTPPNATICSGGPGVLLTANGATTYTWSPSTGLSATTGSAVTAKPSNTTTYTVTGKTGSQTGSVKVIVTVDFPPTILVTPSSASICAGDSVTLTASGAGSGGSYKWTPSKGLNDTITATVIAKPGSTTTYQAIGTTAAGCTNASSVGVTVKTLPVVTATPSVDSVCAGSSVGINVSGASTYTWSPASTLSTTTGASANANPITSTTYTITGVGANGCVAAATSYIKVNPVPTVTVTPSNPEICSGANVKLTASGAVSYTWTPATGLSSTVGASVTATPSVTTNYKVTGTNAGGCSNFANATVTVDPPITVTITSTNVTCNGAGNGMADPGISGGTPPYTFSWSNGETSVNATSLTSGTYTLTVTDGAGCGNTGTITISQPPALIVNASAVATSCGQMNGEGIATVTGGTGADTYSWNSSPVQNTQDATGLSAGNYTVTVTDSNKCTTTGTITVAPSSAPSISVKVVPSNCGTHNGTANTTVTGGTAPYRYSWNNGDTIPNIDSLAAGVYIVTVTDKHGCSSFLAITVSDTNGPSVSISSITQNACYGQSNGAVAVSVSGGTSPYKYSWSNGATTSGITNLSAGPYQVTVTDAHGCTDVKTINITAPSAISLTASTTLANCGVNDGSAAVTAAGGTSPYTYVWSTSGSTSSISSVGAGTYSVLVTDKNGCKDSVNASVSNASGPVVTVTSVVNDNCTAGSAGVITISDSGGTTPYTYLWSNGATTSNISGLMAGNYNVTVTDAGGCIGTANATVTEVLPPAISICMVTVDPSTNYNEVIWNKSSTPKIASYNIYKETTSPGVYGKIGSMPADSTCIYVDSLSNALVRSWRYEISQVDSCGNESPLSLPHKTMHLTINPGVGNNINLIWDNYEGLSFGYYIVYRDSTVGIAKDSVGYVTNSGLYTYTDMPWSVTAHPWYYHMGINNPGGCNPAIEAINYNASKSNTGNFTVSGIANVDAEINSFDVFPNPNNGMCNISVSLSKDRQDVGIRILNTMGQVMWSQSYGSTSGYLKKQLDLSGFSKGVYLVQVTTGNTSMYKKVIVQ